MPNFPSPLKSGDTIALVAPAKWMDKTKVDFTVSYLKSMGYNCILAPNLSTQNGYLADSDISRAAHFTAAWCNPHVKMLWCIAGGFGSTRLLEHLDYNQLRPHKKILVGMSDITALHCALQKELDIVSYLGPMPKKTLIDAPPPLAQEQSLSHLWKTLKNHKSLAHHNLPPPVPPRTIVAGKAKGLLVGGNLSLIASLTGTPWQLDTKNKILILEDVQEEPYRIDRMLRQLKHSGSLSHLAGLILASWKGCDSAYPHGLTLDEVFDDYFKSAPYPSFIGYPSGHIDAQLTLPLNTIVELDSEKHQLIN